MQKLFNEVNSLDKCCYDEFFLSEDILMEHAADGMADFIKSKFSKESKIIVVCGAGNNGADGIALARLLHQDFDISIFQVVMAKSKMALIQEDRAKAIGVKIVNSFDRCDVLIDALYGTGFKGEFTPEIDTLMQKINQINAYKIACDIPSGLQSNGFCIKNSFVADISLTMGALKRSIFSDMAKEFVGDIKVLDLGVSREIYEGDANCFLLDVDDLKLPFREKRDTHKGVYGHLALVLGEKSGAATLSARAALRFGSGVVTLVGHKEINIPHTIMYASSLPSNTTALAIGMGLGDDFDREELEDFLDNSLAVIADADIFHMDILESILRRKNVVITPHPKEFVSLLKFVNLADISVEELQKNRFFYSELFCSKFPNIVLLLKGANVIIGQNNTFYINPHGTSALAKGGSGDVLSGLIGSLLAQGYNCLDAALNASLAHTELAKNYAGADFSLSADDLISGIGNL